MPPRRLQIESDNEASSPDPLAFSGPTVSRLTTPSRRSHSRLRELSFDADIIRGKSPQKTVIIDPEPGATKSPYRIRVTVQAEPRDDEEDPSPPTKTSVKRSRTRSQSPVKVKTTTVPLRDEDRRSTRSGTPAAKRRKGTPRRSLTLPQINQWYEGEFRPGSTLPKPTSAAARNRGQRRKEVESTILIEPGTVESENAEEQNSMMVEPSIAPSSTRKNTPAGSTRSPQPTQARSPNADVVSVPREEEDRAREATGRDEAVSKRKQLGQRRSNFRNSRSRSSSSSDIMVSPRQSIEQIVPRQKDTTLQPIPDLSLGQITPRRSGKFAFSPLPKRIGVDNVSLYAESSAHRNSNQQTGPRGDDQEAREDLDNYSDPNDQDNGYTDSDSDDGAVQHVMNTEQVDEDVMMSGARTIGDDTMMKSMDMTIVSPSSLYSRLDMQSSFLQATPGHVVAKASSMAENSPPGSSIHVLDAEEPQALSSSHVQWSSPLVLPSEKHIPNAQARPTRSSSASRQRSVESSPSKRSVPHSGATRSPGQQLPTPDSDELDKENKVAQDDLSTNEVIAPQEQLFIGSASGQVRSRSASGSSTTFPPQAIEENDVEEIDIYEDETASHLRSSPLSTRAAHVTDESNDEEEGQDDGDDDSEAKDEGVGEDEMEIDAVNEQDLKADAKNISKLTNDANDEPTQSLQTAVAPDAENTVDLWQQAGEHSSHLIDDSEVSSRPTAASFRASQRWQRPRVPFVRTARNTTIDPVSARVSSSFTRKLGSPPATAAKVNSDDIARLFTRAGHFQSAQAQGEQVEDSSDEEDASNQDLSSVLRQKVSNMMEDVDFSLAGETPPLYPSLEQSAREKQGSLPIPFNTAPRLSPGPPLVLPHSPRRSSPLRRHLDDQDNDSRLDEASVLSDVRQLQEEHRGMQQPTSGRMKRPQKSLLKLTQERRARATIGSPVDRSLFESTVIGSSAIGSSAIGSSTMSSQMDSDGQNSSFVSQGLSKQSLPSLSRFLLPAFGEDNSSTAVLATSHHRKGPVRVHRLLGSFRLLPRQHPWTDNHFQSLLSLYRHWQTHDYMYSSSNPGNAGVLTKTWAQYVDMEIYNWGYDLTLNESLVMIAALFSHLLQLEDESQYEMRYGEQMRKGVVARRTREQGPITDWHIILRLCTVILGDVIRKEEARGVDIDRTPALKWRFKGQLFWRRGWLAGIL